MQSFAGPGAPRSIGTAEPQPRGPQGLSELATSIVNEERSRGELSRVSAAERLIAAALNILPDGDLTEVSLDELKPLDEALPTDLPWRNYQVIAGSCGGCGVEATGADVRHFLDRWRSNSRYREVLLDPQLTKLGMVVAPDGRGRKIAVAVLGGG